ncbi:hypothetical protein MXD81_06885 [Microbacteriaceae bacterium K1510]|nr:hypothetical protein [Microbacteriaceae bacterium K1510]
MIRIGILSFALAFSVIGASAQTQDVPQTAPTPADSPGAAPGGMGPSGGAGAPIGTSNAHTTGSGAVANSSPADQPLMATGQDLKGPPTRFPANNTPE